MLHSVSYCDNILSEQKDKCPPYKDKSGNLFLKKEKGERTIGVPEGLSISNTLANIYMQDIDRKYRGFDYISYYRYVDDILILVNEDKIDDVKKNIIDDIEELGLELNEKIGDGSITKSFEYLGYVMNDNKITVRKSGVLKIEQSIEELFRTIKKDNIFM